MKKFWLNWWPWTWHAKVKKYDRLLESYNEIVKHATLDFPGSIILGEGEIKDKIDEQQQQFYYEVVRKELEPLVRSGNMRKLKAYVESL